MDFQSQNCSSSLRTCAEECRSGEYIANDDGCAREDIKPRSLIYLFILHNFYLFFMISVIIIIYFIITHRQHPTPTLMLAVDDVDEQPPPAAASVFVCDLAPLT